MQRMIRTWSICKRNRLNRWPGVLSILFLLLCGCGLNSVPPEAPAPVPTVAAEPAENDPKETAPAPVEIDGVLFSAETPRLVLTGLALEESELEQMIRSFPDLCSVDLRGTSVTPQKALELSVIFPGIDFVWDVPLFGNVYASDLEELDLSGIRMDGTEWVEETLPYFQKIRKIILSDCGIPDEQMDALNRRYENILFVWTVHFSVYSLRTDATYFCASDVPRLGNVAPELTSDELAPLRYCTELEALDLGHMNYRDLGFLRDMTKLRYLILVQGKFSDISVLANMPDLEYLELFNNNRIVDLTPLLSCRKLEHLNIGYCYYAEWETLSAMTGLKRLWMPHVEISAEELEDLQEALPDTRIYAPFTDPMGSTGGGWREDQSYYEMRDFFHMEYLPGGTGVE